MSDAVTDGPIARGSTLTAPQSDRRIVVLLILILLAMVAGWYFQPLSYGDVQLCQAEGIINTYGFELLYSDEYTQCRWDMRTHL